MSRQTATKANRAIKISGTKKTQFSKPQDKVIGYKPPQPRVAVGKCEVCNKSIYVARGQRASAKFHKACKKVKPSYLR